MKTLLIITPHMSTGGCPQVVAKKVELLKDYYQSNPGVIEEQPVAKNQPSASESAEWEEDDNGNFIPRSK